MNTTPHRLSSRSPQDRGSQPLTRAGRTTSLAAAGVACATLAALVLSAPTASAAQPHAGSPDVAVVVEGHAGAGAATAAAVANVGGTVDAHLAILDGVSATVPTAALARLRAQPGVRAVSIDGRLVPLEDEWGDDDSDDSDEGRDDEDSESDDDGTDEDQEDGRSEWGDDDTDEGKRARDTETGEWKANRDLGSAFTIEKETGAQTVWGMDDPNRRGAKLTGLGVGVALIDTGIAPVEGLISPGKVVNGPDLSFESQAPGTRYLDGFAHGTHMAALIAGRDSAVPAGKEKDPRYFVGMAPDATLVNVKVGTADGGVDVSQVIAGIDWVVTNRAKNNIRVINLSYGTDSAQSPQLDPLAHAVESAWRSGVVVVVAAGNDGESGPVPLTMPAIDPYVIAVGSVDHQGSDNTDAWSVGTWTNSGTDSRRPDLLAPGKSVVSLRVPGSMADLAHPEGLVAGDASGRFFRGTGTSQSAAVVSGAAALLIQSRPGLTPDQVKGLLMANADRLARDSSPVQGAGVLDIRGAVEQARKRSVPAYPQSAPRSTGLGSLEASRGTSHVVDPDTGQPLLGEQDPFGVAWDPASWALASTTGTAWSSGTWRGTEWAGSGWSDSSWAPVNWTRRSWSGVDWSRRSWSTMTFLRRSWSGDDFSRRSWSSDGWSRRSWSTEDAW